MKYGWKGLGGVLLIVAGILSGFYTSETTCVDTSIEKQARQVDTVYVLHGHYDTKEASVQGESEGIHYYIFEDGFYGRQIRSADYAFTGCRLESLVLPADFGGTAYVESGFGDSVQFFHVSNEDRQEVMTREEAREYMNSEPGCRTEYHVVWQILFEVMEGSTSSASQAGLSPQYVFTGGLVVEPTFQASSMPDMGFWPEIWESTAQVSPMPGSDNISPLALPEEDTEMVTSPSVSSGTEEVFSLNGKVQLLKRKSRCRYRVRLTWTLDTGADGYDLYRSDNGKKYKGIRRISRTAKRVYDDWSGKKGIKSYYKIMSWQKKSGRYVDRAEDVVQVVIPAKLIRPVIRVRRSRNSLFFTFIKAEGSRYESAYRYLDAGEKWKVLPTLKGRLVGKVKKRINGSKFQIRIRTYQKVKSKRRYSPWSKAITVK